MQGFWLQVFILISVHYKGGRLCGALGHPRGSVLQIPLISHAKIVVFPPVVAPDHVKLSDSTGPPFEVFDEGFDSRAFAFHFDLNPPVGQILHISAKLFGTCTVNRVTSEPNPLHSARNTNNRPFHDCQTVCGGGGACSPSVGFGSGSSGADGCISATGWDFTCSNSGKG